MQDVTGLVELGVWRFTAQAVAEGDAGQLRRELDVAYVRQLATPSDCAAPEH
jgi:hypothetical protein